MEKRVASLQKQLESRRIEFLGIIEEHEKLRLKCFKEKEQELLKHLELYDKLIEKSKKSLTLKVEDKNFRIECSSYSNIQYTTKYNCNNMLEKLSENLSPSDKTIWAEEKKYFCQIKTKELSTIEIKALNGSDDIQTETKNMHLECQSSNDIDYSPNNNKSLIEETDFNRSNNNLVDTNAISLIDFSVQILKTSEQELCLKNKPDDEKLSNTSSSSSINTQRELVVDLNENDDNACEENGNDIDSLEVSNNEIEMGSIDLTSDENAPQCALYNHYGLIKLQVKRQNYGDEMSEDIKLKDKTIIEHYFGNGDVVSKT